MKVKYYDYEIQKDKPEQWDEFDTDYEDVDDLCYVAEEIIQNWFDSGNYEGGRDEFDVFIVHENIHYHFEVLLEWKPQFSATLNESLTIIATAQAR